MPTVPTTRIPTWADGAADVTDPGSSKQATGWIEGEAPAADHTNWLHNARGEWLEFIWRSSLPSIVALNLVDKNTSPFGSDILSVRILWEPTQEKFYATIQEGSTSDKIAYESTDGIAWGSGTTVNADDTASGAVGIAYCPDNARIGTASENGFHLSSSNAVSGFSQTPTGTFSNINAAADVVWDDTNNLWIVSGAFTTAGYIETAAAAGTSWTTRHTEGSAIIGRLAHDRAGQTVAIIVGTDNMHYSSNATTWTQQTTGMSKSFTRVEWCPFASLFVAYNSTSDTLYWSTDGDVWALCPFGALIDHTGAPYWIVCEDFMLFADAANEELHYADSADAIKGDAPYINMGAIVSANDLSIPQNSAYSGSDTAFSYYNADDTLVNCTFGF